MKHGLAVSGVLISAAVLAAVAGCGGSHALAPVERQDISSAELQTIMDDGQPLVLVDVRTQSEFAAGHIPGSVNLPIEEIETWAPTLGKNTRICCICGSGARSLTAANTLVAEGFQQVYNLLGGMLEWTGDVEDGCGCGS